MIQTENRLVTDAAVEQSGVSGCLRSLSVNLAEPLYFHFVSCLDLLQEKGLKEKIQ